MNQGRALILLDGLDEVRDKDFDRVRKTIEAFATVFARSPIVVTCRIAAREYSFDRFTEVEMADFSKSQIQAFAHRWFSLQGEGPRSRTFMTKLTRDPSILELASSPLLLTLLCLVFQERNGFDGTRAELYREGFDVLLRKWDAKRGIERDRPYGLTITDMETLLGEIAYQRFLVSEYFFDQDSLEEQIRAFFKDRRLLGPYEELRAERVLNSIEANLGLLVERALRVYSFSHLTFQEYLTARRVARKPTLLSEIGSTVGDRRWREVWMQLATMIDADYIIPNIARQVGMLIAEDSHIQGFLKWCRLKAEATPGDYRPAALRAVFFAFRIPVFRSLQTTLFDLDPNPDLASARDIDLNADLSLARALDPPNIRSLERDPSRHPNVILERALQLALQYADFYSRDMAEFDRNDIPFELDHNSDLVVSYRGLLRHLVIAAKAARVLSRDFSDKLEQLRKRLSSAPNAAWSISEWAVFYEQLRAALIDRNVGQCWNFDGQQAELLDTYYRANLLLLECIEAARGLRNEVRRAVEDSILLPWTELADSEFSLSTR